MYSEIFNVLLFIFGVLLLASSPVILGFVWVWVIGRNKPHSLSVTIKSEHEIEQQNEKSDTGIYVPNQVSIFSRVLYATIAIALLAYGSYGLYVDDIYLPSKHGSGQHLHGIQARLIYGVMLCLCIHLFSSVVDHYDRRDNERYYRLVAKWSAYLGLVVFFIGMFIEVFTAAHAVA